MKARIVPITETRRTVAHKEAEDMLRHLTHATAIEITPDHESLRTIKRIYKQAAAARGVNIRFKTRNNTVYVQLR